MARHRTTHRDDAALRDAARETFGWPELRPEQLDAMRGLLDGRDVLAVLPSGGGKSAIYQVPALLMDGPTVIVSPLIALQNDQVEGLRESDAPEAVAVNSAQSGKEARRAWRTLRGGDAEYLFLAPEQLAKDDVVAALRRLRPALFVVDEAHCVSLWGHDFRPDYLRLADAVERLGRPAVLALTATASPVVRDDVVRHLRLRDPRRVVASFDRPGITLTVRPESDDDRRREAVVDWAAGAGPPGLVYAATRKDTERYAEALAARGVSVRAYHAGLKGAERESAQQAFMDGEADVVVATSAFGMGIDKADVRFVAHAAVPDSLDSYYQEIGRAGRDGRPARAVLFYRPQDLGLQRFLTARHLDGEGLADVAKTVRDQEEPLSVARLGEETGQSRRKTTALVGLLAEGGAVRMRDGRAEYAEDGPAPDEAVDRVAEMAERQRQVDRSRLEMLRGYAETLSCRRRYLLGYFGEQLDHDCGNCDSCASGSAAEHAPLSAADAPWRPGSHVRHAEWGPGVVVRAEDDRVTVVFERTGYRTLSLAAVREHGLLTEA
ncbi:RecQ family ATP-dependent DNA helicase [Streptomyces sp. TRM 70351]|uniref:RecQ family ATP-dependent DNA helicase n=1 Tax=Streptomyces sp. TRM 70351 TaxID=3116552 RepID=UPI002E7AFB93|nr:RecQ family ATP-dependent DNA helicase [Streptomyces sp. TRM 70351]MEE1928230.1 RecQ family ATP-dependent DNA helicase [Streptomyces sp. TRM 70351]